MTEAARRLAWAMRALGADDASADALTRADSLWLARVLPDGELPAIDSATAVGAEAHRQGTPNTAAGSTGGNAPPTGAPRQGPGQVGAGQVGSDTTALFVRQTGADDEPRLHARRVPVPAADALPGRAALERALRPFKRRRPSRLRLLLDAQATAEASARASADALAAAGRGPAIPALVPVLRPEPERWFDMVLLAEQDDTLRVFEDTVRELRQMLARHGAFRRVGLWRWRVSDGAVQVHTASGMSCAPLAMLQGQHPQLIWVLTHGASAAWNEAPLRRYVRCLAARAVVAVVQLLPETAWGATALGESRDGVRSRERAAANRQLLRRDLWTSSWTREGALGVVPLLPLQADSVALWAEFVMSPRTLEHAAVVIEDPPVRPASVVAAPAPAEAADAEAEIREQVLRFRAVASPQAFALLRLLSGAWITLPVMRLLLQSLPGPRTLAPMAEVLLSGLLRRTSAADVRTEELSFEFVPGVREWLSGSLSGDERRALDAAMANSREAIRQFVESRLNRSLASFGALLLDSEGTELLPASARAFVEVSRRLRTLRGALPVISPPSAARLAPPIRSGSQRLNATETSTPAETEHEPNPTEAETVPEPAPRQVPQQLFVNRVRELARMRDVLLPAALNVAPGRLALVGAGGAGKTALAEQFLRTHWGADDPGRVVRIDLVPYQDGIDGAATLGRLLAERLKLDAESTSLWPDLQAELQQRPRLLMFDDVLNEDQSTALSELAHALPDCPMLVTSRRPWLDPDWTVVHLASLPISEALELLRVAVASLGEGPALEGDEARALVSSTEGAPRSLLWAAHRWHQGETTEQILRALRLGQFKDEPDSGLSTAGPESAGTSKRSILIWNASTDLKAARALLRRLIEDGHQAWLDAVDLAPGQDWMGRHQEALSKADTLLACISRRSVSMQEGGELALLGEVLQVTSARPLGSIDIIPVQLDACEVPGILAPWNAVNLSAKDGYRRLRARLEPRPKAASSAPSPSPTPGRRPSIYISYANEDHQAVRRIVPRLEALGFECVWSDLFEALSTDEATVRLEAAQRSCDFFMPVLSDSADKRHVGRYWAEWRRAVERAQRTDGTYLLPVGIDRQPPGRMGYHRIFKAETAAFATSILLHAPNGHVGSPTIHELSTLLERHGDPEWIRRKSTDQSDLADPMPTTGPSRTSQAPVVQRLATSNELTKQSSSIRVLVVQGEPKLANFLYRQLIENGYHVEVANDALGGLHSATSGEYDILLLDHDPPGMDSLHILREFREAGRRARVLILSSRDRVEDRIAGLKAGADDYMVKPFAASELLARIEALARRN